MSDFTKFLLKAFVRKLLTLAGAYLVTIGVLTEDEGAGLVERHLEEILGTLLIAGAGLWTVIYQRYVKRKVETAIEMPPDTTKQELEAATAAKKEGQ